MELYSKEELLKELKKEYSCGGECDHCPEVLDSGSCAVLRCIRRIIDNTSPVDTTEQEENAYNEGYAHGFETKRPQGDTISREALKDLLNEYNKHFTTFTDIQTQIILDIIDHAQPVEIATKLQPNCNNLQPTQGEWIRTGSLGNGNAQYECSNCHYGDEQAESQEVPYCWHCGAKMQKGGAKE